VINTSRKEIDMADETGVKPGPAGAASTTPPATPDAQAAEETQEQPTDPRLLPGGLHGTAVDPGMSSIDPDTVIGLGRQSER
jgi:hypothetical protein